MNSATARMLGSLLMSLAVAFNFWQVDNFYLGKRFPSLITYRLHILLRDGNFHDSCSLLDNELLRQELEREQRGKLQKRQTLQF